MRKAFHFILLAPLLACLVSLSAIIVQPDERIQLSAISDRILWVEITKVTIGEEEVADGIGYRKATVEGKIIETVRGVAKDKDFRDQGILIRVIDGKAYEKVQGGLGLDVIHAAASQRTGIEDCKVGGRYLVISSRLGDFYVEVSKNDEDWRPKIQKRIVLPGEDAGSPPK